jgi:hypothetical protein
MEHQKRRDHVSSSSLHLLSYPSHTWLNEFSVIIPEIFFLSGMKYMSTGDTTEKKNNKK